MAAHWKEGVPTGAHPRFRTVRRGGGGPRAQKPPPGRLGTRDAALLLQARPGLGSRGPRGEGICLVLAPGPLSSKALSFHGRSQGAGETRGRGRMSPGPAAGPPSSDRTAPAVSSVRKKHGAGGAAAVNVVMVPVLDLVPSSERRPPAVEELLLGRGLVESQSVIRLPNSRRHPIAVGVRVAWSQLVHPSSDGLDRL